MQLGGGVESNCVCVAWDTARERKKKHTTRTRRFFSVSIPREGALLPLSLSDPTHTLPPAMAGGHHKRRRAAADADAEAGRSLHAAFAAAANAVAGLYSAAGGAAKASAASGARGVVVSEWGRAGGGGAR